MLPVHHMHQHLCTSLPPKLGSCNEIAWMARAGGDNAMTNAEQAQGQLLELAALRQCFTELALPPAVRQTLDSACTESEKRLQQRLEQMTWQIQRSALLGDIAGKIVHEIRNPLNAIFLHADVVQGELQCPTLDSRTQMLESLTDIRLEVHTAKASVFSP